MCILETSATISSSPLSIKKKLYGPFLWMGFRATTRRMLTFYPSVPRSSWHSIDQPRKDERLSWPWSQPVVFSPKLNIFSSEKFTTSKIFVVTVRGQTFAVICSDSFGLFAFLFLLEEAENSQPIDKSKCFKKKIQLLRHVLLHF